MVYKSRTNANLTYAYTKEVMSFNATIADAQVGICAFLEKRRPEWKGK